MLRLEPFSSRVSTLSCRLSANTCARRSSSRRWLRRSKRTWYTEKSRETKATLSMRQTMRRKLNRKLDTSPSRFRYLWNLGSRQTHPWPVVVGNHERYESIKRPLLEARRTERQWRLKRLPGEPAPIRHRVRYYG